MLSCGVGVRNAILKNASEASKLEWKACAPLFLAQRILDGAIPDVTLPLRKMPV